MRRNNCFQCNVRKMKVWIVRDHWGGGGGGMGWSSKHPQEMKSRQPLGWQKTMSTEGLGKRTQSMHKQFCFKSHRVLETSSLAGTLWVLVRMGLGRGENFPPSSRRPPRAFTSPPLPTEERKRRQGDTQTETETGSLLQSFLCCFLCCGDYGSDSQFELFLEVFKCTVAAAPEGVSCQWVGGVRRESGSYENEYFQAITFLLATGPAFVCCVPRRHLTNYTTGMRG